MSHETNKRKDAYRTDYAETPKWADVQERLDIVNLPNDISERANDIIRNFSQSGKDIQYLSAAIHQVLVPGYRTKEIDFTSTVASPDGTNSKEMAHAGEREVIFEEAADLIRILGEQRQDKQNDQEFLNRVGNIVSLSIVLAHKYADGNGRTARLVGELIRNGPHSADLRIAGANRPESGVRLYSYLPKDHNMIPSEVLTAAAALNIPLADADEYQDSIHPLIETPY